MPRLKAARKELKSAQDALVALRIAPNLDALESHWIEFVHHLERCWNKVHAEMKDNSKWQGWKERGHIEQLRTSDPLVAYLRVARGAEEHGIADITVKQRGGFGIRGNVSVVDLRIDKGRVTGQVRPPAEIVIMPARLKLAPVNFRNRTYEVPTSHAGQPMPSDPVAVAVAGVAFYASCLARIEAAFPL